MHAEVTSRALNLRAAFLIAPYAAWMVLMTFLPQTAWAYAVRGGVTAVLLAVSAFFVPDIRFASVNLRKALAALGLGVAGGLAVLVIWIAPEMWMGVGAPLPAAESPYSPEVCGLPLTLAKLAASAFVIPIAEEMFFRRWLVEFAGFWWMVALFAVEHGDRWHVGAITGVVYGLLAKRFGLWAAIVAHMVTNFGLGLIVILCDRWQFW